MVFRFTSHRGLRGVGMLNFPFLHFTAPNGLITIISIVLEYSFLCLSKVNIISRVIHTKLNEIYNMQCFITSVIITINIFGREITCLS